MSLGSVYIPSLGLLLEELFPPYLDVDNTFVQILVMSVSFGFKVSVAAINAVPKFNMKPTANGGVLLGLKSRRLVRPPALLSVLIGRRSDNIDNTELSDVENNQKNEKHKQTGSWLTLTDPILE